MGYRSKLVGTAQDLGDGRFGVVVEIDDATYYVEHAVTSKGLVAQIWDESRDELVSERQMEWGEVIERMLTVWQPPTGPQNGVAKDDSGT